MKTKRPSRVPTGLLITFCITVVALAQAPESLPANPSVVVTAGEDWIPLKPDLEIEPGSALDFSALGFVDAPAGKHGRVIARPDGQFAFANSPDQASPVLRREPLLWRPLPVQRRVRSGWRIGWCASDTTRCASTITNGT